MKQRNYFHLDLVFLVVLQVCLTELNWLVAAALSLNLSAF